MLSAAELTAMRAVQQESMLTSCTVSTPTSTPDGLGGQTDGTPSTTSTVCRVVPTGGRESEIAAQLTEQVSYTITLPYGTTITAESSVVVGGDTYRALAVLDGGTYATAIKVLAVKVV